MFWKTLLTPSPYFLLTFFLTPIENFIHHTSDLSHILLHERKNLIDLAILDINSHLLKSSVKEVCIRCIHHKMLSQILCEIFSSFMSIK